MFERAKHPEKSCYQNGGCKYFKPICGGTFGANTSTHCCHYMLMTGEKRESDPFNCNKFKKRYE